METCDICGKKTFEKSLIYVNEQFVCIACTANIEENESEGEDD
jgi:formylmethanofuran dehydrogenase subunit E